MIARTKFLILAVCALIVLMAGALFIAIGTPTKSIRNYFPSLFPLVRSIVWEMDHEIPNVGEMASAPLLELKLSRNDIAHFDELYTRYERDEDGQEYYLKNNSWRKAELRYTGKKYSIKIKSQGRSPTSHRKDQFISYTIKVTGGKSIEGVTRFNLIIRERVQPQRLINILMAEKFGLINQRLKLVRVKINSWDEKLYFLEDRLTSKLMETRFNSSLNFFKTEIPGSLTPDKALIIDGNDIKTGIDEKKAQQNFDIMFDDFSIDENHRAAIFDRYMKLNRTIERSDYSNFHQFFSLDYISSFEAVRFMMGFVGHGALKGNLYAPINFSDGNFYPVIVRDHLQSYLSLKNNESIESKLEVFKNATPFLTMLSRNDIIRQKKYQKAYNFILHDNQFLKEQREIFEKHERLFFRGWITQIMRKIRRSSFSGRYDHNRKVIKQYLEDSKPMVQFLFLDGRWVFKISPGSMAALNLQQIEFKGELDPSLVGNVRVSLFKDEINQTNKLASYTIDISAANSEQKRKIALKENALFTSLDENLRKIDSSYFLVIGHENGKLPIPTDFSFLFNNTITQKNIDLNKVGTLSLTENQSEKLLSHSSYKEVSELETFVQTHTDLNFQIIDRHHLILSSGNYQIEKDLVLPKGVHLSVEEGASISLGPMVNLIVRGGLNLRGTKEAPIYIQSIEDDVPFGTLGVLGDGSTKVRIEHLILENGNESWHDGVYFSGSLALYHHKQVKIVHSSVGKGHADDGVNIKFVSDLKISDSEFFDNYADQVDLDYVLGTISSSIFYKDQGDSNGDGLDVSGSNVLVKENIFSGFNDKGVSVGEDSRVYFNGNRLSSNRKGMAIKDNSIVYVGENEFRDNELDIDLYRKKKIFSGGQLYLVGESGRKLKMKNDKFSAIHHIPVSKLESVKKSILTMEDRTRHFIGYKAFLN